MCTLSQDHNTALKQSDDKQTLYTRYYFILDFLNSRKFHLSMSYESITRVRSSLYFVIAVAQCSCFGDPHCLSFDDSRLDFQGDCQYVLSTNMCNDTVVWPPFEVLAVFSDRGVPTSAPATWVEEVTVNIVDYVSTKNFCNDDIVTQLLQL